jgi:branched-chain amino acid transport system substrate-binding protein
MRPDGHRSVRCPARGVLALALLTLAGCAWTSSGPIRIGMAGNFHDPTGAPAYLGAELAVEEVNAAGGIDGRSLELVVRDDHAHKDSAVAVATDLYQSDVVAVIGHVYSGPTLAAAAVYNAGADPVVEISPSASAPAVSKAGPYTFRLCPSDFAHGDALAGWVHDNLHLSRGAVLYLNDDYGRGVRSTFVRGFRARGGSVEAIDPYLGSTPDVGPYLDDLIHHERAEFLVVAGYRDDAATILRQARAHGFTGPLLGGDGLEGIQSEGALAEGVYTTAGYMPMLPSRANERFVAAYRRKYPDASAPNSAASGAYDAVHLLRDVIGRVGTDRRRIRDALAQIGTATPAYEGVAGRIAFDSAGDVPSRQVYIGVIRDGAVRLANGH